MKKTRRVSERPDPNIDTMRPEYDFSKGVRGKYAGRFTRDTVAVVLDPDVSALYPDAESVNAALREHSKRPKRVARKSAKSR